MFFCQHENITGIELNYRHHKVPMSD